MVYGLFNWWDKIKLYGIPSRKEWRDMAITIAVLALIIGFDDGRETFELSYWFANYIVSLGIIALTFFAAEFTKRAISLRVGFRPEYKMWPNGLALGLILTLISQGKFWYFLAAGNVFFHHLVGHRLGYFRYGLNVYAKAVAALGGPAMNLILGAIVKNINLYVLQTPLPILDHIFMVNLWFAVISMLPLPTLSGGDVFYHSRLTYVFTACTIIAYAIMVTAMGIYSWVLALLVGGICWLIFLLVVERGYAGLK